MVRHIDISPTTALAQTGALAAEAHRPQPGRLRWRPTQISAAIAIIAAATAI
jgi:hypothetical protein